jgi:hypothetical protein
MLITVIGPELILGKAMSDLFAAMDNKRKMEKYAKEDGVEWGLAHGFFANMGGFVGTTQPRSQDKSTVTGGSLPMAEEVLPHVRKAPFAKVSESDSLEIHELDLDRGDVLSTRMVDDIRSPNKDLLPVLDELPSSRRHTPEKMPTDAEGSNITPEIPMALSGDTLFSLREEKYIERLPDITSAELSDKSKGNVFIKAIAIGQVLWNSIQIIARAKKGLNVTQLELAVAAFSFCAIVIYLLLLEKPQGVQVPTRPIDCSNVPPSISHSDIKLWITKKNFYHIKLSRTFLFKSDYGEGNPAAWYSIPNDSSTGNESMFLFGSVFCSMIFGAIHIAGWNLVFHNDIEQLIWRVASIYTAASLLISLFAIVVLGMIWGSGKVQERVYIALSLITIAFYVIARLFLIVEYFRTLFYLPPDAYISTWASNIPHIG